MHTTHSRRHCIIRTNPNPATPPETVVGRNVERVTLGLVGAWRGVFINTASRPKFGPIFPPDRNPVCTNFLLRCIATAGNMSDREVRILNELS